MILEDSRVRLEPLEDRHVDLLQEIGAEPNLVAYSPSEIENREALLDFIKSANKDFQLGTAIPFAIYDKHYKKYAGCTRYMNINARNKVLEIGSTWIGREFQGSGLNTHMKRLMLDHAFKQMGYEKVEFRIDERNIRSRKAVEKLGAQLEGILRENVYLKDGFKRNTCCYGLLRSEWTASDQN